MAQGVGKFAVTAFRERDTLERAGVSTRAAVTMFAMEHGLVAWGELPIGRPPDRP